MARRKKTEQFTAETLRRRLREIRRAAAQEEPPPSLRIFIQGRGGSEFKAVDSVVDLPPGLRPGAYECRVVQVDEEGEPLETPLFLADFMVPEPVPAQAEEPPANEDEDARTGGASSAIRELTKQFSAIFGTVSQQFERTLGEVVNAKDQQMQQMQLLYNTAMDMQRQNSTQQIEFFRQQFEVMRTMGATQAGAQPPGNWPEAVSEIAAAVREVGPEVFSALRELKAPTEAARAAAAAMI